MIKKTLFALSMCAAAFATVDARAEVTIKLATMAPDGSTWHVTLKKIAEQWATASNGQVKLKIFAGGVQGDEGDVVKKMRIGQLHAGALTAIGLKDVAPEPTAVCAPLMITSYPELDYVMDKVGPKLEKSVADKGFVVLTWTDTGTMYFFSQKPAATPADMASQKVFAVSGDPVAEDAWRSAGFTPVVLSSVNMIPSLQTGMVNAFTSTPLIALSLGWYSSAKNMTLAPWGMLVGALVVSKKTWDKVPADLQPKLLEIVRAEALNLKVDARKQEAQALKAMQDKGLNVVTPTAPQLALWNGLEGKVNTVVRGKVVPEAIFDDVKKARDEFRASQRK
jgi:TRAP-type C4-dicarboxylate transport system substrate-binding protein